jgi:NAD(P)H-dependent flavin oxidoreductase YrpB (nitropropane dioxygenase family)
MGIFGGLCDTPDELAENIKWIRERVGSKPFGVDLIFPASMPEAAATRADMKATIPEEYQQFMRTVKQDLKIPDPKAVPGPRPGNSPIILDTDHLAITLEGVRQRLDVVIDMKVPVFAAGLGSPGYIIDSLHAHGIKVFSLVGNVRQAKRVAESGVDYVVAQGYDSAGHTGEIGTFSLIPQAVDAVYPTPVLAAGGVVSGRQVVAALALGAVGVWTGTVWLPTRESDHLMSQKQALLDANERDTVRTRVYSGKPGRFLRNAFTTAWEQDGAPKPLPLPYQVVLVSDVVDAAFDYDRVDLMRTEVNQSVGLIKEMKTVRQTVFDIVDEAQEAMDRMGLAPA